jgi:tyrosinase
MAPNRYVSDSISIPTTPDASPRRADLEFYGIDHSGSSFEARVFLNNQDADECTPKNESSGYAGSFYVFGHGGCFGDVGHCDVPQGPRDPFDRRPKHPLTPQKRTVVINEALWHRLESEDGEVKVTVVPVPSDSPVSAEDDLLRFERFAFVTYD